MPKLDNKERPTLKWTLFILRTSSRQASGRTALLLQAHRVIRGFGRVDYFCSVAIGRAPMLDRLAVSSHNP